MDIERLQLISAGSESEQLFLLRRFMMKLLAVFLSFIFLVLPMGCRCYYKVGINPNDPIVEIQKFKQMDKYIIVHHREDAWNLYDIKIENDSLTGRLGDLPFHRYKYETTSLNRANRYKKMKESFVLDEVHIYISEVSIENNEVLILISDIQKIEVYERDNLRTTGSWLFGFFASLAIIGAISAIVLANMEFSLGGSK